MKLEQELQNFIENQWPISTAMFRPIFGVVAPIMVGDTVVYAIKNSTGVVKRKNGEYVFIEKDGTQTCGPIRYLTYTSVGKELTYLESIADTIAAGHEGFLSAFSINDNRGPAVVLGEKHYYAGKPHCRVWHAGHMATADNIICLRNEYLLAKEVINAELPQPIAEELCAALSDTYI